MPDDLQTFLDMHKTAGANCADTFFLQMSDRFATITPDELAAETKAQIGGIVAGLADLFEKKGVAHNAAINSALTEASVKGFVDRLQQLYDSTEPGGAGNA